MFLSSIYIHTFSSKEATSVYNSAKVSLGRSCSSFNSSLVSSLLKQVSSPGYLLALLRRNWQLFTSAVAFFPTSTAVAKVFPYFLFCILRFRIPWKCVIIRLFCLEGYKIEWIWWTIVADNRLTTVKVAVLIFHRCCDNFASSALSATKVILY